jgi:hypothetical protein
MSIRTSIALLLGCLLMVGCQGRTQVYSVSVRNDAAEPLMVGLAKDGPPFEDHWATPEEVSRIVLNPDERGWGVPVLTGKTAEVKNEKATLNRPTAVYVRIYASAPTLPSMLAISSGSPNRLDIPLHPGDNQLVVTRSEGQLTYKRLNPSE